MKYLKLYEDFNTEKRRFDKESLREMAGEVWETIKDDERVIDAFVWGSFFEKDEPKDIDIVIELNTAIGQFDDKIKLLSELQKKYITIKNGDGYQYPIDLTIVDSNGEAFLLFANSTKDIEESPERTKSYNNLDENRPIKKLIDMFE